MNYNQLIILLLTLLLIDQTQSAKKCRKRKPNVSRNVTLSTINSKTVQQLTGSSISSASGIISSTSSSDQLASLLPTVSLNPLETKSVPLTALPAVPSADSLEQSLSSESGLISSISTIPLLAASTSNEIPLKIDRQTLTGDLAASGSVDSDLILTQPGVSKSTVNSIVQPGPVINGLESDKNIQSKDGISLSSSSFISKPESTENDLSKAKSSESLQSTIKSSDLRTSGSQGSKLSQQVSNSYEKSSGTSISSSSVSKDIPVSRTREQVTSSIGLTLDSGSQSSQDKPLVSSSRLSGSDLKSVASDVGESEVSPSSQVSSSEARKGKTLEPFIVEDKSRVTSLNGNSAVTTVSESGRPLDVINVNSISNGQETRVRTEAKVTLSDSSLHEQKLELNKQADTSRSTDVSDWPLSTVAPNDGLSLPITRNDDSEKKVSLSDEAKVSQLLLVDARKSTESKDSPSTTLSLSPNPSSDATPVGYSNGLKLDSDSHQMTSQSSKLFSEVSQDQRLQDSSEKAITSSTLLGPDLKPVSLSSEAERPFATKSRQLDSNEVIKDERLDTQIQSRVKVTSANGNLGTGFVPTSFTPAVPIKGSESKPTVIGSIRNEAINSKDSSALKQEASPSESISSSETSKSQLRPAIIGKSTGPNVKSGDNGISIKSNLGSDGLTSTAPSSKLALTLPTEQKVKQNSQADLPETTDINKLSLSSSSTKQTSVGDVASIGNLVLDGSSTKADVKQITSQLSELSSSSIGLGSDSGIEASRAQRIDSSPEKAISPSILLESDLKPMSKSSETESPLVSESGQIDLSGLRKDEQISQSSLIRPQESPVNIASTVFGSIERQLNTIPVAKTLNQQDASSSGENLLMSSQKSVTQEYVQPEATMPVIDSSDELPVASSSTESTPSSSISIRPVGISTTQSIPSLPLSSKVTEVSQSAVSDKSIQSNVGSEGSESVSSSLLSETEQQGKLNSQADKTGSLDKKKSPSLKQTSISDVAAIGVGHLVLDGSSTNSDFKQITSQESKLPSGSSGLVLDSGTGLSNSAKLNSLSEKATSLSAILGSGLKPVSLSSGAEESYGSAARQDLIIAPKGWVKTIHGKVSNANDQENLAPSRVQSKETYDTLSMELSGEQLKVGSGLTKTVSQEPSANIGATVSTPNNHQFSNIPIAKLLQHQEVSSSVTGDNLSTSSQKIVTSDTKYGQLESTKSVTGSTVELPVGDLNLGKDSSIEKAISTSTLLGSYLKPESLSTQDGKSSIYLSNRLAVGEVVKVPQSSPVLTRPQEPSVNIAPAVSAPNERQFSTIPIVKLLQRQDDSHSASGDNLSTESRMKSIPLDKIVSSPTTRTDKEMTSVNSGQISQEKQNSVVSLKESPSEVTYTKGSLVPAKDSLSTTSNQISSLRNEDSLISSSNLADQQASLSIAATSSVPLASTFSIPEQKSIESSMNLISKIEAKPEFSSSPSTGSLESVAIPTKSSLLAGTVASGSFTDELPANERELSSVTSIDGGSQLDTTSAGQATLSLDSDTLSSNEQISQSVEMFKNQKHSYKSYESDSTGPTHQRDRTDTSSDRYQLSQNSDEPSDHIDMVKLEELISLGKDQTLSLKENEELIFLIRKLTLSKYHNPGLLAALIELLESLSCDEESESQEYSMIPSSDQVLDQSNVANQIIQLLESEIEQQEREKEEQSRTRSGQSLYGQQSENPAKENESIHGIPMMDIISGVVEPGESLVHTAGGLMQQTSSGEEKVVTDLVGS